jgi:ArsR family transcriptional regulator
VPSLAAIFKALSNPNRLRVYQIVCRRAGDEGITIDRLAAAAKMKQPAVSHHVARLAAAGLVERRKSRWWVHCTPGAAARKALERFCADPAGFTDGP